MKLNLIITFLLCIPNFAQTGPIDFHSPENIKKFADHLFCEKDFLRANFEYQKLENVINADTLNFKMGLGFLYIGDYSNSIDKFSNITVSSTFFDDAKLQELKAHFLIGDYSTFREITMDYFFNKAIAYSINENKLFNLSYLFTNDDLPPVNEFFLPFNEKEKEKVGSFYNWKASPPYKNEALAGILSAIIPGSGKMYVGEWGDGITALLATGLFTFLAFDNFRAKHNTRAWIFTGLGAFFYAGNVYGSVAAAQVFNAKISFEFENGLNLYLEQNNYFTPEYNFCE